jgi:hypothetical protein
VLGLALVTALLFGLGPALRASRPDVARSFGGGDAVVTGGNRRLFGMRNVLLMGQFAVSALFVLVSGVFVAGYLKASTGETGIGRPDAAAVWLDLWITRPDGDEIRGFMERCTRRASETGGAAIAASRRLAHEVDPDTPVGESKSVAQWLEGYVYGQWVYAAGFGSLAALAMLLACLGLYGALTFAVAQQTREFGVRMALGADGPAIRRMMLWQGLRVAGLGAAAGLYAAVLGIETIAKITQAVPGRGPLAFTVGPAVLIAVALLACYLPARRASRLDPVETLRAL